MLNTFFSNNLPYCLQKNKDGSWTVLNREYLPLSYNNQKYIDCYVLNNPNIKTWFKGLTDKFIIDLVNGEEIRISRNDKGEIMSFFLYHDGNNPIFNVKKEHWDLYFEKIRKLSKLKVDLEKHNINCSGL